MLLDWVAFSMTTSCLFVQDETIGMINGWPRVLEFQCKEDGGVRLKVIKNMKIVVTSLAGLAMVIGFAVPTFFRFAFRAFPLGLMSAAEAITLLPLNTIIPRIL